ncbi:MAG: class I SAM-dependent methyltransferase [Nitrososphaeraceae archaeon]
MKESFGVPLWIFRRNESDIINCYNFLTPFVVRATGGTMLNFGYWGEKTINPNEAQIDLCKIVGEFAQFQSAKNIVDIGSGFSAPALYWNSLYKHLNTICLNVNFLQLKRAIGLVKGSKTDNNLINSESNHLALSCVNQSMTNNISVLNGTAKQLPFKDQSIDRVIALESAQHFRPLIQFIQESRRILNEDGLLILVLPVLTTTTISKFEEIKRLGLLSFTWASEHYEIELIKSLVKNSGFRIIDIRHIGDNVYRPVADYYAKNRHRIKDMLLSEMICSSISQYPKRLLFKLSEHLIYRSALKMKDVSQKGYIDYVLIKAKIS